MSLNTALEQLNTQKPLNQLQQEYIIQGFLHRLVQTDLARRWVLRGGLLTQHWIWPAPRPTDDLDFLSLDDYVDPGMDALRLLDICQIYIPDKLDFPFQLARVDIIWEETEFPGLRATLPVFMEGLRMPDLQIDIGYGDPICPGPITRLLPCHLHQPVELLVVRAETLVGWKLHGLFEFDDRRWRAKDLLDLYRYFEHTTLDAPILAQCIAMAFSSRDTSLDRVNRLLYENFGQSRGSRRQWQRFLKDKPERHPPEDLQHVIDTVRTALRPHVEHAKTLTH